MFSKLRKQLVVCVDNSGYAASLEKRKIYVMLRDTAAEKRGLLRIVDESGEDYLYPRARSFYSRLRPRRAPRMLRRGAASRKKSGVTEDGCQIITNFPSDRLISCGLPGCEVF